MLVQRPEYIDRSYEFWILWKRPTRTANNSRSNSTIKKTNKNGAAFPPEVIEVYRRNASQSGALKAMINFYRAYRYGWWERERKWRQNLYGPITISTLLIWGDGDEFLDKAIATNTHNYVTDLQIRFIKFLIFLFRRYNDKSSTSLDLENFLVDAYAKQIKELNSSTGKMFLYFYLVKYKQFWAQISNNFYTC